MRFFTVLLKFLQSLALPLDVKAGLRCPLIDDFNASFTGL